MLLNSTSSRDSRKDRRLPGLLSDSHRVVPKGRWNGRVAPAGYQPRTRTESGIDRLRGRYICWLIRAPFLDRKRQLHGGFPENAGIFDMHFKTYVKMQ